MSPLRIALLTYSTRPRGSVVHTLALAEGLADRGHAVTVWTLGRDDDPGFFRAVDPAVEVRVVPLPAVPGEGVGARVERSIALLGSAFTGSYDIVHAQDCITANAVPDCVRTVHHLDRFSTPELVACHHRAIVAPRAHVCVSAAVAGELLDGYGVVATVIPNGVAAGRFAAAAGEGGRAAREGWRARLGPYVLAVGGIEPRKGSLDLLTAMALLRDRRPDLAMVVAGGETLFDYREYRTEFDARAGELGVTPVVLGPVADAELPSLVAAADVFAFPSTKEGFGLAAMEALAAGVPLVTRELPVLREVFGGAAWFAATPAELASALVEAADDRGRHVGAGRALAAAHTWGASAQAHEAWYVAVLAKA